MLSSFLVIVKVSLVIYCLILRGDFLPGRAFGKCPARELHSKGQTFRYLGTEFRAQQCRRQVAFSMSASRLMLPLNPCSKDTVNLPLCALWTLAVYQLSP